MTDKKINLGMTAYDDLFQTDESRIESRLEKVLNVPLSEIDDFPDHPFKVKDDETMQNMVESIKAVGVQTPAIVRLKEDGRYELISGHRRKMACNLAGIETIPVIIRQMSRDEAVIAMVDANLQREIILPSEKAKSYKMRLEAMNRQGKRTDLTSSETMTKFRSDDLLAKATGEKNRNIVRQYIALNELIEPILQMVDDGKMALSPAEKISFLSKEQQTDLFTTMESEDCTPSYEQTLRIKRLSDDGRLNIDVIFSILTEEKPNQKEQFKMPRERISKYFPTGTPVQKIEDTIIKALELYQRRQRQQER